MNPPQYSDEQLESALRSLPLRQPSGLLDHRVTQALAQRAFPWRGLAAAACFGGLCFWFGLNVGVQSTATGTSPVQPKAVDQPGGQDNSIAPVTRLASGPTRIDTQWPIAQAQLTYDIDAGPPVLATIHDVLERTCWVDPENNRNIELTRPVREVTLTRQQPH